MSNPPSSGAGAVGGGGSSSSNISAVGGGGGGSTIITTNINVGSGPIGSSGGAQGGEQKEKKRKESILDLRKYLDKAIRVKFSGGRETSGILKGFDPLLNLVMDNTIEYLRDPDDPYKLTEDTRERGLVVCRGTAVVLICPMDGCEAIANPFVQQE